MSFLLQIISGWPELFVVVLLVTIVYRMPAMNLNFIRSSNCKLFDQQRNPLYLNSFCQINKRPLSFLPSGDSLFSLFRQSGQSPEIKSSRLGILAFLPGSVKRVGFLMGIFVVLPTLFRVVLFSPAVFAKALSFSILICKTQSL